MPEDGDPTDPRHGVLELLQALADKLWVKAGKAGDIAARPREAGDESAPNRIADASEDNRDGRGRLLRSLRGWCGGATMTLTLSATSSAASAGNWSSFPSANR